MRHTVPNVLQILHDEHKIIRNSLNSIERQVGLFDLTGKADLELLMDKSEHLMIFLEQCHCPKEDLLVSRLLERSPALAADLPDLVSEHQVISKRLYMFMCVVDRSRIGATVERDIFIGAARQLIRNVRCHMAMEEKHFFQVALRELSADDWSCIDGQMITAKNSWSESTPYRVSVRA